MVLLATTFSSITSEWYYWLSSVHNSWKPLATQICGIRMTFIMASFLSGVIILLWVGAKLSGASLFVLHASFVALV